MLLGDAAPELHPRMKAALYALMMVLVSGSLVAYQFLREEEEERRIRKLNMCLNTWCLVSKRFTRSTSYAEAASGMSPVSRSLARRRNAIMFVITIA